MSRRPPITTVHLVYPHGSSVSTPDAIGRNLGRRLEEQYHVVYHDWDARYRIPSDPSAALGGHAHPSGSTVFRRSAPQRGWGRVLMLSPYVGDPSQVAFVDAVIAHCDLYLAITGPYWYAAIGRTTFAHWAPKMVHLDLAVDRADFPAVKSSFSPPSRRRFVYIGNAGRPKNIAYLGAIARLLPGVRFAWIGSRGQAIPGVESLGWQDFGSQAARDLVASFDFLITVGRADGNPTTILEAMSWGLIPVCTPQSGYANVPGIINIPLDDAEAASRVVQDLEAWPAERLLEIQAANWRALEAHYTWDRFARQVIQAIESNASPGLGNASWATRARLRADAFRSPYGPIRRRSSRVAAAARRRLAARFPEWSRRSRS